MLSIGLVMVVLLPANQLGVHLLVSSALPLKSSENFNFQLPGSLYGAAPAGWVGTALWALVGAAFGAFLGALVGLAEGA